MNQPISLQNTTNRWRYVRSFLLWIGCLCFAYPLLGFIITGTYARYIQDDYCYAAYLARYPFFEGQTFSYMHIDTYSGNRYSLNLLTGLSELAGRVSVQVLPGLAVLLCVTAFVLLLRNAARLAKYELSWPALLLAAEALVFLALTQAPNLFQVLYWRAGMLPYLAPVITQVFMTALVLRQVHREDFRPRWLILTGLLAFLAAGFSETAAAFQAGLAILFILLLYLPWRRGSARAAAALRFCGVVLLVTFLGMLVLIVSPINARRLVSYPEPPSLFSFLKITLQSGFQLLVLNVYRRITLLLFTVAFFFLLALSRAGRTQPVIRLTIKQLLGALLLVQLVNFGLLLCCAAPSVYFYTGSPDVRVLTAGQFSTTLALAVSSYLMGCWWKNKHKSAWETAGLISAALLTGTLLFLLLAVPAAAQSEPAFPDIRAFLQQHPVAAGVPLLAGLLALPIMAVYRKMETGEGYALTVTLFLAALFIFPLRLAGAIYDEIPLYRQRAETWDRRDSYIRAAEKDAVRRVTVEALDSMYGVADLQPHPDNWLNNCAEWYYGMEWISAVEQ